MSLEIRPLRPAEVPLVRPLATRAFDELRRGQDRPARDVSAEQAAGLTAMHAHLQATSPDGCLLALDGDEPVGAALSYVRGGLWVLSLLVVEPGRQSLGAGSALLRAALAGAPERRLLHATTDSRALRAYTGAGFRLLPALLAEGLPEVIDAPQLVDAELDGPFAVDLQHVRATGGAVLALPGDPSAGRAVIVGPPGRTSVAVLDPADEARGAALLAGALARAAREVDVGPLAPQEHWAVTVCLRAGLTITPCGPVAVAGVADPLGGVAPAAAV